MVWKYGVGLFYVQVNWKKIKIKILFYQSIQMQSHYVESHYNTFPVTQVVKPDWNNSQMLHSSA